MGDQVPPALEQLGAKVNYIDEDRTRLGRFVPVKILASADPVFNFPNKIGPSAWANWVQERGLYFLGEKDPKYIDLVSMTDSFKDNPGKSSARWWRRSSARESGSI